MSKIGSMIQQFVFADPNRAMRFMSSRPTEWWEQKGEAKALATFHEKAEKVPAYRSFLEKNKVNPEKIKTFDDFRERVPLTDKENYILKNPLKDLCHIELSKMYTVAASSGTSGLPCFWPRAWEQDKMIPKFVELALLRDTQMDKKSTLLIVGLALGVYSSGEAMTHAMKDIAKHGKYPLTVATPGSEKEGVLQILKHFAPYYEQISLWAYPSFLREVIDGAEEEGIDLKNLNLWVVLGGEGFTKQWEDFVKEKLGLPKGDPTKLLTIFGESAGGVVGVSSPLTSLIRELAFKDSALFEDLFGKARGTYLLPILEEFNPLSVLVEEIDGELVITKKSAIPIVRYNLHDIGGVISHQKALGILKDHKYDPFELLKEWNIGKEKVWTQPMFYVFGRSDNVVSVDGANIYPESLEEVIYSLKMGKIKGFKLGMETDPETMRQRFTIYLELKEGVRPDAKEKKRMAKKAHDLILEHLLKVNLDYRKSYNDNPKSSDPLIEIHPAGKGPFQKDSKLTKRRLIKK